MTRSKKILVFVGVCFALQSPIGAISADSDNDRLDNVSKYFEEYSKMLKSRVTGDSVAENARKLEELHRKPKLITEIDRNQCFVPCAYMIDCFGQDKADNADDIFEDCVSMCVTGKWGVRPADRTPAIDPKEDENCERFAIEVIYKSEMNKASDN